MNLLSPVRNRVYMPWARIPPGEVVELPGRGRTYVTDTPGPDDESPTIVLLHALGCTGLLTWYPCVEPLARRFRVVTLDLRWHGQGIHSEHFSLVDCADDVIALLDGLGIERALVGGYSMGSIVAQRVWRQHPERVEGLVLAATTDRFRMRIGERLFFGAMETAMLAARGISHSRTAVWAARAAADAADFEPTDIQEWALREFKSTSPWAVGQALSALGRHHSRPWLGRIDVPTAVVVLNNDRVIPPGRQRALARAIPGATIHDIDAGHAACALETEVFVPGFLEAAATVNARRRDFRHSPSEDIREA